MSSPSNGLPSAPLVALKIATRKYRRVTRPRWSAVKVVGPAADKAGLRIAEDIGTAAGVESSISSTARAITKPAIEPEMDESDFVVVDKPEMVNDVSARTDTKPPVKKVSVLKLAA